MSYIYIYVLVNIRIVHDSGQFLGIEFILKLIQRESTGRPTRSGLEALGLGFAADKLEAAGKLGA